MSTVIELFKSEISFCNAGLNDKSKKSITISTDKQVYSNGDVITITGKVNEVKPGSSVSFIIKSPFGSIVSIGQVTVNTDKKFSAEIEIKGSLFEKEGNGTYTITVQYGTPDIFASTTFSYDGVLETKVTITPVLGSATPGCEDTANGCYTPNTVTVNVGDQIVFSNTDTAAHTFTAGSNGNLSGEFDTGLLMSGVGFGYVPKTIGDVPYFCVVHPWMQGLIIVK